MGPRCLDVTGLPAPAADTAGDSVVAAHVIAERAHLTDLAASANAAYVHGMALALLVCGLAALVSALLAAAFLPGTPRAERAGAGNTGTEKTGTEDAGTGHTGTEDTGTEDAGTGLVNPSADARQ